MSNLLRAEGGSKVPATNVGTNGGVSVTLAAIAASKFVVTHISGSGDAAAVVTLETPTGTVVWQKRFAAAFTFSENFHYGEYESTMNSTVTLKISASTSHCEANLGAIQIPQ